jgi:hypothetical protein
MKSDQFHPLLDGVSAICDRHRTSSQRSGLFEELYNLLFGRFEGKRAHSQSVYGMQRHANGDNRSRFDPARVGWTHQSMHENKKGSGEYC